MKPTIGKYKKIKYSEDVLIYIYKCLTFLLFVKPYSG